MNQFNLLVDAAQDHGSAIDNKPVFAVDYLAEGIDEICENFGVSRQFAYDAIYCHTETCGGKHAISRLTPQSRRPGCIRCGEGLYSYEALQTGICPNCWTGEDEHDGPPL